MVVDPLLLFLTVLAAWSLQETVTLGSHTARTIPGSAGNVSKNDPGVQKAVLSGTYAFNNKSNDIFLFKSLAIDKAERQVVKGIKYILEVEISRTVCRKTASNPDLSNCHFQPKGKLHQIFHCHFEVWSLPWLKWMNTTFFVCHP
ncbi:cystatin-F [Megalops cyprinoides]|uniref:cystatin-F n=1 Tax=Megalops cyprinoides TaxID=118141 RepID=UPI001864318E|nr:cystatin-F [Megalops cyprinoides]